MPKFPRFSTKQILKLLLDDGFVLIRQKGSHQIFWHEAKKIHVTVPVSKKDLPIGTARSILKLSQVAF